MPSRRTEIGLLHLDRQEPILTTFDVNAIDRNLINARVGNPEIAFYFPISISSLLMENLWKAKYEQFAQIKNQIYSKGQNNLATLQANAWDVQNGFI